jgi:hypothetical protein
MVSLTEHQARRAAFVRVDWFMPQTLKGRSVPCKGGRTPTSPRIATKPRECAGVMVPRSRSSAGEAAHNGETVAEKKGERISPHVSFCVSSVLAARCGEGSRTETQTMLKMAWRARQGDNNTDYYRNIVGSP